MPKDLSLEILQNALDAGLSFLSLQAHVKPLVEKEAPWATAQVQKFIITTKGPDRKGLVAGISEIIAKYGVNITFCFFWFALYVLIGAFIKVWVIRRFSPAAQRHSIRFWPVFLSHALFSVLCVNLYAAGSLDTFAERISLGLFFLLYLVLLPIIFDILLLRILPRLKGFGWLRWSPPWKWTLIVSFTIAVLSCGISWPAIILIVLFL